MDPLAQDERISAYLDGELPGEERARFEEELTRNSELRQLVEELRSVRDSMQALPQHHLEADFAERVLRRAERQMLTSQPIHAAAAATPPAVAAQVTPAARELVSTNASSRHWRSWRPWAWSAIALSVAAVLVANNRGQRPGVQVAMDNRTLAERDGKEAGSLPTGTLAPREVPADRAAQSLAEKDTANDADASALRRGAIDKLARDLKAEGTPADSQAASGGQKKGAAAPVPTATPAADAPAAPALAAKSAAPASLPAPAATAFKTPLATHLGKASDDKLADEKGNVAKDSVPGTAPSAAAPADGRLNPLASTVDEGQVERKRDGEKVHAVNGPIAVDGLLVVQCAATPDVPRQAFQRLLAQRGIAFYDAPPTDANFAAAQEVSDVAKALDGAPREAAGALPPAAPHAAPAPLVNQAEKDSPLPALAKQTVPAATQPATKLNAAPPSAAIAANAQKERKAPAEVDRLQGASAPADDIAVFYVEGTPEQVFGLLSDLRSQPVVYRSLAVNGTTASPPPEREEAAKRTPAMAGLAPPSASNHTAASAGRARQPAAAGGQTAVSGSAWAVPVNELPPRVAEKLKAAEFQRPGALAKSDEQRRQLSPQRTDVVREPPSAGSAGEASPESPAADADRQPGSAKFADAIGSAGGAKGAARGGTNKTDKSGAGAGGSAGGAIASQPAAPTGGLLIPQKPAAAPLADDAAAESHTVKRLATDKQRASEPKTQFGGAAAPPAQRRQQAQNGVEVEQLRSETALTAPRDQSAPEPPRMQAVILFRLVPGK